MLKTKEVIVNITEINESVLIDISDKLWKLGKLEDIKGNVESELFYLHVGINMIGIWKSEGWSGIIGEQADLIPYIPTVLLKLNLPDVRKAFEDVIKLFPDDTVYKSDSEEYYDIYNFYNILSYKVQNEKLKVIAPEKRREMVKLMRNKMKILEELTQQYWSDDSEAGGWQQILDYVSDKILVI